MLAEDNPMTTRKPEISLYLRTFTDGPHHDWRATLASARAMDIAGIDRVVVSDHVVFGENLEAYADPSVGGSSGGRQPTGPDGSWLEPLTVLTAIAATTDRIRLGTSILLAALRRPAVLAKQLATLDVLSEVASIWVSGWVGSGRNTTRPDSRSPIAGGCSTTPWTFARRCGPSSAPPMTHPNCPSTGSTKCRNRCNPAACRVGSAAR